MSNRAHWNLEPHGTVAAYRRHYRRGQKPCQLCREAESADNKRRRLARKENGNASSAGI